MKRKMDKPSRSDSIVSTDIELVENEATAADSAAATACDNLDSIAAELIVLDESGGDEDDEEVKEVDAGGASFKQSDSDVEIVLERATPDLTADNNSSRPSDPLMNHVESQVGDKSCSCADCPFKEEYDKCVMKVKRLTRKFKRMQRTSDRSLETSICKVGNVEVRFLDETSTADKHQKKKLEAFLRRLFNVEVVSDASVNGELSEVDSSPKEGGSFVIDKRGQSDSKDTSRQETPLYDLGFSKVLDQKGDFEMVTGDTAVKPGASCFNCSGNHFISDCPEPVDRQRIANSRREHLLKRQQSSMNYTRYHDDESRNSKFTPGHLSNPLRKALGLDRFQIPLHIYRMRIVGYPPGWLKEAEVVSSGITVYNSDGKAEEEIVEDGEVGDPRGVRVQHDPEKLVSYPGFNVVLPEGVRDDWRRYGFPPMQEMQMKYYVESTMKAPDAVPYKRKRSDGLLPSTKRQKVSHHDVQDMELDEDHHHPTVDDTNRSSSEKDETTATALRSSGSNSEEQSAQRSSSDSDVAAEPLPAQCGAAPASFQGDALTLDDLEDAKKQLMSELVVEEEEEEEGELPTSDGVLVQEVSASQSSDATPSTPSDATPSTPSDATPSDATPSTLSDATPSTLRVFSASKDMELGSPAIYVASPFKSLPSAEKFATGISEHMNFENLPDSTGKFETMKLVLRSVRQRMATLHNMLLLHAELAEAAPNA